MRVPAMIRHATATGKKQAARSRRSDRRHRLLYPVEDFPRDVGVAPTVDVTPIEVVPLDGEDVANVLLVLGPSGRPNPTELADDHVLRTENECLASPEGHWPTSLKPLPVVGVL